MNLATDYMAFYASSLLADEIGLGKTLSMIALIARTKDFDPEQKELPFPPRNDITAHSTPVIVPGNGK